MTKTVDIDNAQSSLLITAAPILLSLLPIPVLTKPAFCAAAAGLVVNTVCDAFEKRSFAKNRLGLVSASVAFGLLAGAGWQSAADLNAAAQQRQNDVEYPLPKTVKAGDGPKLLKKLLTLNMLEETEAVGDAVVWREHEDGYKLTLVLADAGFKALGLAREEQAAAKAKPKATEKAVRKQDSRQDRLVALLRASKGATIDELCHEFGWQPHSARAIISVTIKRKLGLEVTSAKVDGRGRVYKVAA